MQPVLPSEYHDCDYEFCPPPKPRTVHSVIVIILLFIVFWLMNGAPAAAQSGKDQAAPDDSGVKFDSYPHPFSQGALAYTLGDRWDTTNLTFAFDNCPDSIDCETGFEAVRAGFRAWAEVSALTFSEVSDPRQADIELQWSNRGPELGYPGDILAYATFPSDGGDVVFDDAEPWSAFDGSEFDLVLTATHEIGHALGLGHSADPSALMYPVLTGQTYGIASDDAAAIRALYGTPEERPPANDVPSSPSQDEQASGEITDDVPYELWEFEAFEGETLVISMEATSGSLEPYLGILTNDEETVLAESGPAVDGVAQIIYTFDTSGTYVAYATREGAQEGFTTGSYTLTLETTEAAAPPETIPTSETGDVIATIRSYTPVDLCEVYLSLSTTDDWEDNLLTSAMTNGNYIDVLVTPGVYDVLVVGCDGSELEQYGIEITSDVAIEIYEDEINVYVYGS
jgi:hypothetical protein